VDSILSLDALLSQPATAEELRALIGGGFARYARTVVAIAAVVAVVAIGMGLMMGEEPESQQPSGIGNRPAAETGSLGTASKRPSAGQRSFEVDDEKPPILARMRGPVLVENAREAATPAANEAEPEATPRPLSETGPAVIEAEAGDERPPQAPVGREKIVPAAPSPMR
jgi:hypothetical protein